MLRCRVVAGAVTAVVVVAGEAVVVATEIEEATTVAVAAEDAPDPTPHVSAATAGVTQGADLAPQFSAGGKTPETKVWPGSPPVILYSYV